MASTYTVKSVLGESEWTGRHGTFKDYELLLDGSGVPDSTVTLTRKPETQAPSTGDELYGHIEDGPRGPKLKLDQRPTNGSQATPAGSSGDGPSEEYWEARNRSIVRQHSQEMALRFAAASGFLNELDLSQREVVGTVLNSTLRPLVDWFERDTAKAQEQSADERLPF